MCSGLVWMFPGLSGLPAEARSTSKPWSARHRSSSSRRENSSPGRRWVLQTEHRKHSMWYTLSRALITRSLLQKPMLHFAHLMPNNLEKGARRVCWCHAVGLKVVGLKEYDVELSFFLIKRSVKSCELQEKSKILNACKINQIQGHDAHFYALSCVHPAHLQLKCTV